MKKVIIVEDESLVAHHLKLMLTGAGYKVCAIADSVDDALSAISSQKPDLVLLDIRLKGIQNGIDLARMLTHMNLAFVYITANFQGKLLEEAKSTMPYGFVVKPFREDDVLTTLAVAFFRLQNSQESRRLQEMELDQHLRHIYSEPGDQKQQLLKIAQILQPHVPFDYLNVIIMEKDESTPSNIGFLRIGFDDYQVLPKEEFQTIHSLNEQKLKNIYNSLPIVQKPRTFNGEEIDQLCDQNALSKLIVDTYDFESALLFQVQSSTSQFLRYEFYSREENFYTQQHVSLLTHLQIGLGGSLQKSTGSIADPQTEKSPAIHTSGSSSKQQKRITNFDGIVGQSYPMLNVLNNIATVSPLDTSVLILGESGTGKERVAQTIHALSPRNNTQLVIVNCASLPASLIESELFGHEKGSFTGATERRIGKFELANGGTIFLDEIGEMTVDLQVKLLRVLQEQEIERVGGKGPVKIDVRIIAATNRNLEQEMAEGRFRLDLYYRLFVFPITIPSLRERPDDIPALTAHFVAHYAKKYNRSVTGISPEVMDKMINYYWPGNVRELEHFIERSILLAKGPVINEVTLPVTHLGSKNATSGGNERIKTIDENERDYILNVLKKCNGRIRGSGGAAEVMGLPPTTLHSKMKKLGIK